MKRRGARLAPFDLDQVREITMYDELDLDTLGDRKTALFLVMSLTISAFTPEKEMMKTINKSQN